MESPIEFLNCLNKQMGKAVVLFYSPETFQNGYLMKISLSTLTPITLEDNYTCSGKGETYDKAVLDACQQMICVLQNLKTLISFQTSLQSDDQVNQLSKVPKPSTLSNIFTILAPSLDKVELSNEFMDYFKNNFYNNKVKDGAMILNNLLKKFSPTFIRLKEKGESKSKNLNFVCTLGVGRNDVLKLTENSQKNVQEAEDKVVKKLVNYLNCRIDNVHYLINENENNLCKTNFKSKNKLKLISNNNIDELITFYKQSKICFLYSLN